MFERGKESISLRSHRVTSSQDLIKYKRAVIHFVLQNFRIANDSGNVFSYSDECRTKKYFSMLKICFHYSLLFVIHCKSITFWKIVRLFL